MRWGQLGQPIVPSLVVDGVSTPILHVSQIAPLLGLPVPPSQEGVRLAWDAASVLGSWIELIEDLDLEQLTQPTPSRDRSLRNLTVNVFHPFELLPEAWRSGTFDWNPDLDEQREQELQGASAVVEYARVRHASWVAFVLETEDSLSDAHHTVASPRGEITYDHLLAQQRWHAAFHHRQLVAVPRARRLAPDHHPGRRRPRRPRASGRRLLTDRRV